MDINELATRCITIVERISGSSSIYSQRVKTVIQGKSSAWAYTAELTGVVKALRYHLNNDYLTSFEELIHGNIFADYLEMAHHLLQSGYKDAAAIITGSILEAHIRQLCLRVGIPISFNDNPKKADTLNADLVKVGAYPLLDQKNVTAWLGLRNDAAHKNYGNYSKEQVLFLVDSIRNFITRHPA